MTKFVSRRGVLGVAIEATRGTATEPTFWIPYATMGFKDTVTEAREEQGLGNLADTDSKYVVMKMAEGSVDAQIYDKALGVFLTGLFGASPSTSGSNPYTHTFTQSNTNQHKSLSLYWQDPDRDYLFPLAMIESFQISIDEGGIVNYSVGFKSKTARDWTTQTADFTSLGNKFLQQHTQFKLAADIAGLSAATAISIKQLNLTITKNTMYDGVLGTVEPEDILNQQLTVEGDVTLNLEDDTWRNYMLNGDYKALSLKLNRSSSSSMELQFPRVDFSEWEPDLNLNEIAKQKINFKANYDAANAQDIIHTGILINGQATY